MADPALLVSGMANQSSDPVGFIGLGVLGQPMALNLARAGVPLVVWNRSEDALAPLQSLDVRIAATVADLFQRTRTVILMLATEAAIDEVMRRGTTESPHWCGTTRWSTWGQRRPGTACPSRSHRGGRWPICRGTGLGIPAAGRDSHACGDGCGRAR